MPQLTYPGYLRRKKGDKWKMVVSVNGKKHYGTCTAKTKAAAANKADLPAAPIQHRDLAIGQEGGVEDPMELVAGIPLRDTDGERRLRTNYPMR